MIDRSLDSNDSCGECGWWSAHSARVTRRTERTGLIKLKSGCGSLTWGPSGCCPLMESGPAWPRGAAQALICCKATRWMDRTAEFGMDSRSHLPQLQRFLFRRCLWYSGFLFSAVVWGQHQGKAGLKQEEQCRDRADSWGLPGTTGWLLGWCYWGLSGAKDERPHEHKEEKKNRRVVPKPREKEKNREDSVKQPCRK